MERSLEMVQAKLVILGLAALGAVSCGPRFTWESHPVDGHRTGVVASNASNVPEAMGVVADGVYTAPNGRTFTEGSIVGVAQAMLDVQPAMAELKQVIGHSTKEMLRYGPECELANWTVDHIMEDVARLTGKHVDVGVLNLGGIRVDMPAGDVLLDDIVSMFPFKNFLTYVGLKGKDLLGVFEFMASTQVQPVGGVKIVVTDHKIDTLLIGGQPLDPEKLYGVATIDFLIDGGDGLTIAKNSKELIITESTVIDSMLPYAKSFAEAGKPIEYFTDGRAVVRRTAE